MSLDDESNVDATVDSERTDTTDESTDQVATMTSDESTDQSAPTLHIPPFITINGTRDNETRDAITKLDWLPAGLKKEVMEQCYKKPLGLPTTDNQRDMNLFATACAKLFPEGRVFASHIQLDQAADMFLNSWDVKTTHPGQRISCFYAPSIHKCERLTMDETKHRTTLSSPKQHVCCPFRINYSLVGRNRQDIREECNMRTSKKRRKKQSRVIPAGESNVNQ
jgi:galactitol-specific phosphotransferase system IIB component